MKIIALLVGFILLPVSAVQAAGGLTVSRDDVSSCFGANMKYALMTEAADEERQSVSIYYGDRSGSSDENWIKMHLYYYFDAAGARQQFEYLKDQHQGTAALQDTDDRYKTYHEDISETESSIIVEGPVWTLYGPSDHLKAFDVRYALLCGKNYVADCYMNGPEMTREEAYGYLDQAKICVVNALKCDMCEGLQIGFDQDRMAYGPTASASPVLGADPSSISPLGFFITGTGEPAWPNRIGLCAFEEPINISLTHQWEHVAYALNADGKPDDTALKFVLLSGDMDPPAVDLFWKRDVSGSLETDIPLYFGGVFQDIQRLPKGTNQFNVFISSDELHVYVYRYDIKVDCDAKINTPAGREFFYSKPAALPGIGDDPRQIQPFFIGTAAFGGNMLTMGMDFCTFESAQDVHFGMYSPFDDPFNIYFVNGSAQSDQDLFQQVPFLSFLLSRQFPPAAFAEKTDFELYDEYGNQTQSESSIYFFKDLVDDVPKGLTYYIAAVTPHGVRDKCYAWIVPLDVNIKSVYADYWRLTQGKE